MIIRKWTAPIPIHKREEYINYIMQTGFAEYNTTKDNQGAFLTLEERGDKLYVTTLTFWESVDPITCFAGENYQLTKYYKRDDEFLLEMPKYVEHQEMIYGSSREIRVNI
ncbi:hypothetical protein [Aliikangiella maris]|uniref:Uncharacterized protein n=2 Tax=Aliikangiella maris TaxID=3162458 RepID=A0ABV2BT68_9GAMM